MHFWANPITPHPAHQAGVAASSRQPGTLPGLPKDTHQEADGHSVPPPHRNHGPLEASHMDTSITILPLQRPTTMQLHHFLWEGTARDTSFSDTRTCPTPPSHLILNCSLSSRFLMYSQILTLNSPSSHRNTL